MLEGSRIVIFLEGAGKEDGENGAKCLWNGHIREKSSIFFNDFRQKNEKVLEMGRPKSKLISD